MELKAETVGGIMNLDLPERDTQMALKPVIVGKGRNLKRCGECRYIGIVSRRDTR